MDNKIKRTRRSTISQIKTNLGKKGKPKLIGKFGKRKQRSKSNSIEKREKKKNVFGDVTQGFKDTVQSVIDEGGSPKLTTTEARVDRITDKLTKPKLALRGGGRAYGKNS